MKMLKRLVVASTVCTALLVSSVAPTFAVETVKQAAKQTMVKVKPTINRTYGYMFTPPSIWQDHFMTKTLTKPLTGAKQTVSYVYKNTKGQTVDLLFNLSVYDIASWENMNDPEGPSVGNVISKSKQYVFVASYPFDLPYAPNSVDGKRYSQMVQAVQKSINFRFVTKADIAVEEAKQLLGTPFKEGGRTTTGFDASGFVRYIWQKGGSSLPATAEQMSKLGTTVKATQVQRGDLLFFKTGASSRINFVGISLGNDKFIGATVNDGVAIESLTTKVWKESFVTAKRVPIVPLSETVKLTMKKLSKDVLYWQVSLYDEAVAQRINATIRGVAREYQTYIDTKFNVEKAKAKADKIDVSTWGAVLEFDKKVQYNKNGKLSLTFWGYEHTGGAHPMPFQGTLNFDLKTGKEVELKSVVTAKQLPAVNKHIKAAMKKQSDIYWAETFKSLDVKADQFYFTDKGITVYFAPYQYSPYAAGFPEIAVPKNLLK